MKFDFLKKLSSKAIAITAVSAVLVVGGGTAIAFAATAPRPENPEISEQEAKAAIFSHAGVAEENVLSLRIDKGSENGVQVYEIEFKTAEKNYDYDIVRSSGEILHASYEVLGYQDTRTETSPAPAEESPASTPGSSSTTPETTKAPATSDDNKNSSAATQGQTNNNASSAVTKEQAQSIALKDAGVAESDTQFVWVKEDYDDGRAVYDVEFYAGGVEYDYEIERSTGQILSSDRDIEHYTPSTGDNGTVISIDEARSIALKKVPGATESDVRIELEWDDGHQIYEGEIYYDRMEYEFEIDASTGTVIEWSTERWDD